MDINAKSRTRRVARRVSIVGAGSVLATVGLVGLAGEASAVTQAEAEAAFNAAGITWTSTGGCTDRNNPSCTSFEGLRQDTVDGAVTLKRASGCPITITGATEVGHAGSGPYSHSGGGKLDYRLNDCLNGYITGNFAYVGERGDGPIYESGSGNQYVLENSSHWDVTYYNCGGCAAAPSRDAAA